ncbi:1-acyl-sn-glycerol-3-phosphate acyltransferase [hydrothermal vent metagenome]|uniref:1-acyl-sn-glycerol-3-phosphate acyltransferase n=1 Tax=hydrothermal vent metagenome TaxID=652676 RepID=A0A3B0S4T2_9ZZZZ
MLLKLRSLVFLVVFYLWGTTSCLLWLPMLYIPGVPRRWHVAFQTIWLRTVHFWLRLIVGLGMTVRGREYISDKAVIYAVKHQSMLDTFIMHAILDDPTFIMKQELLQIPLYGRVCEKVGNIPIDRDMGMKSMKKMLKRSRREIDAGRSVIIFPEGSRADPGEKHAYLPGIFGIYKYLDVPVVPVAVNTGLYWPRHGPLKPGKFVIEFLPPIAPGLQKQKFMTRLEETIETASRDLLTLVETEK